MRAGTPVGDGGMTMSGCKTRREAREENRAGPAGGSLRSRLQAPGARRLAPAPAQRLAVLPQPSLAPGAWRLALRRRRAVRLAVVVMLILSQVSFSFGQRG